MASVRTPPPSLPLPSPVTRDTAAWGASLMAQSPQLPACPWLTVADTNAWKGFYLFSRESSSCNSLFTSLDHFSVNQGICACWKPKELCACWKPCVSHCSPFGGQFSQRPRGQLVIWLPSITFLWRESIFQTALFGHKNNTQQNPLKMIQLFMELQGKLKKIPQLLFLAVFLFICFFNSKYTAFHLFQNEKSN